MMKSLKIESIFPNPKFTQKQPFNRNWNALWFIFNSITWKNYITPFFLIFHFHPSIFNQLSKSPLHSQILINETVLSTILIDFHNTNFIFNIIIYIPF